MGRGRRGGDGDLEAGHQTAVAVHFKPGGGTSQTSCRREDEDGVSRVVKPQHDIIMLPHRMEAAADSHRRLVKEQLLRVVTDLKAQKACQNRIHERLA